jgi:hypothetical protein
MFKKVCPNCKITFYRNRRRIVFCSRICTLKFNNCFFKKGHKGYKAWLGKRLSNEHRQKISDSHKIIGMGPPAEYRARAEKHPCWTGDDVTYNALHKWVRKYRGKSKICADCGKKGEFKNGKWTIQWANLSKKYKRDLEDFVGLCIFCHRKYDKKEKSMPTP